MVEIDTIHDANEGDTTRDGPRIRSQDVAEESDALRRIELCRDHLLPSATHGDGRPTGGAQIEDPVDLPPGSPDPPPTFDLDDRDCRGAGQAARPTADRDEPIRPKRLARRLQELQDRAEQRD
jgi:hypothetical protein